jgi:hypothetical protein
VNNQLVRRRILALFLGLASLTPAMGATPARAEQEKVVIYTGSCALKITVDLHGPIGFTTLGNPGYDLIVQPLVSSAPCLLSDDVLSVIRTTTVDAGGSSSIFNCSAVVASGGWSQWWRKPNGIHSPQPVVGGSHRLYGTFGDWVLETEGPSFVNFLGVAHLTVDPTQPNPYAACSNGSLWELHLIGTQVFEDPQP